MKVVHGGNELSGGSPDDNSRSLSSRINILNAADFLQIQLEAPKEEVVFQDEDDDDYYYNCEDEEESFEVSRKKEITLQNSGPLVGRKREGTEISTPECRPPLDKRRKAATKKPVKSKAEKKQVVGSSSTSGASGSAVITPHHFGTGSLPNNMFWIIDDNTLLFRYTLINVSDGGTTMKCLEQDCQFLVQNPTGDSLDLFENMKEHVEKNHFPETWNKPCPQEEEGEEELLEKMKKCPVANCSAEFQQGSTFRSHLAGEHSKLQMVVCEICWKPMKNIADNYQNHKWFHKSPQEKQESQERPPRKFGRSVTNRKSKPKIKQSSSVVSKCTVITPQHLGPGSLPNNMFWIIDDNTLLFRYTLINVSDGGTRMKCQEQDCQFLVQNPAGDSLDMFQNMKEHVEKNHFPETWDNPEEAVEQPKRCPVLDCSAQFQEGSTFRSHLAGEHSKLQMVVCEICWKPMRNIADNYRSHKWFHKSPQEKLESQEAPPTLRCTQKRKGSAKIPK